MDKPKEAGDEELSHLGGASVSNLLALDRSSLSLHFETLVKKIGQLVNENTREELLIECLEGEVEDLERETLDLQRRRDNFSVVEHDLALIQAIVTEEEKAVLEKKRAERDNAKHLSYQREHELEERRAQLQEIEVEIKEFHVKIEENELKRIGLQKKIQLKAEKIEKILSDIEVENKVLRELNDAALQRSEDLAIIREHEDLVIQRDSKVKELEKLKQKQSSMEEKIALINQSLEKIERDLIEAREAKDIKLQEIEKVQEDFDSLALKTEELQKAVEELEALDSEITFLNYYISKAELRLMQFKKENRAKLHSEMENAKLKQVESELMSLPTNSYSEQGRGKIDSTVKNILDKMQMNSPQSRK